MRHVEFGGGLGDVITMMFNSDRYTSLEDLPPEERALIVIICHNPAAKEFFLWHPKVGQFTIRDLGFWWPHEDVEKRKFHGLPPGPPFIWKKQESLTFFPAPDEAEGLAYLKGLGKYLVVSACAGGRDRNVPRKIVDEVIKSALGRGLKVVAIGRKYNPDLHEEYDFTPADGLLNLVGRLSAPATAIAVAQSAGVFCCHSAMCLLSWYLRKPVFLLYPKHTRETHFKTSHQYTFGKDFPTTVHAEFSDYSAELRERFFGFL